METLLKQQTPREAVAPPSAADAPASLPKAATQKGVAGSPTASESASDREQEAEEAKRQLDAFLRRQRLLFKEAELELEFAASYSQDTAEFGCLGIGTQFCALGSPITSRLITRSADGNLVARYGLADDVEFDLIIPFTFVEQEQDINPLESEPTLERTDHVGLSDVAWAVRYAAYREDGIWPDVVFSLNAKSPTGDEDRGLGTGNWNVGGAVTLVKTIDPVVFFGGLGYTAALESEGFDPGDQILYSVGMGFSLNDQVAFSTSLIGAAVRRASLNGAELIGSGVDFNTLLFATTVRLAEGLFLEPFVGFGLTKESGDFIVGINVPYRLPGKWPLPFFHD